MESSKSKKFALSHASHSLLSGALAGSASVLILQPLDVIKTRMQASSNGNTSTVRTAIDLVRREGPLALWRGTLPTILRNSPGAAIYFCILTLLQRHLNPLPKSGEIKETFSLSSIAMMGALARAIAGTIVLPATVLKVRMEASQSPLLSFPKEILHERIPMYTKPLQEFLPNTVKTISSINTFIPNRALDQTAVPSSNPPIPSQNNRPNLSISKLKDLNHGIYSYDTNRLKMKLNSLLKNGWSALKPESLNSFFNSTPYIIKSTSFKKNTIEALQKSLLATECINMWRTGGIRSFYRGALATAMRDAPHAAIHLTTYEQLKHLIRKANSNNCTDQNINNTIDRRLRAGAAALAGITATVATHPFDVIKTHVQLQKKGFVSWKRSLFAGLTPRLLRKGLSSAVTWSLFEELAQWNPRSN